MNEEERGKLLDEANLVPTAIRILYLHGEKLDGNARLAMEQLGDVIVEESLRWPKDVSTALRAVNTLYKITNGSGHPTIPDIRKSIQFGVELGLDEVREYACQINKRKIRF